MTNATVDLIEEINCTKFWHQQVAERYPDDYRNQQAIDILTKLQVELEKLGHEELEQALASLDDRSIDEPIIPELLRQIGFSWKPEIYEFIQHIKSELQRHA